MGASVRLRSRDAQRAATHAGRQSARSEREVGAHGGEGQLCESLMLLMRFPLGAPLTDGPGVLRCALGFVRSWLRQRRPPSREEPVASVALRAFSALLQQLAAASVPRSGARLQTIAGS